MALACGVKIFETATLNSLIMSGVTWSGEMPLPLAMDFCRLPRWSIAAAAMIPFLLESAFMWRTLPSDKLINLPFRLNPATGRAPEFRRAAGNRFGRVPHRGESGSSALPGSQTYVPHEPNG